MDFEDIHEIFFVAIVVILILAGIIIVAEGITHSDKVKISQETADKICQELTGEDNAIAKDWWDYPNREEPIDKGQLSCEIAEDQEEINGVLIRRQ